MEWSKQKLAHYLGKVKTVVEFKGITGEELERVFQQEAMKRLQAVEDVIHNEYLSDAEKIKAIYDIL